MSYKSYKVKLKNVLFLMITSFKIYLIIKIYFKIKVIYIKIKEIYDDIKKI
jgi:hypothetical protein